MFVSGDAILVGACLTSLTLVFASETSFAMPTPKEDFAAWYREWTENLPGTYNTTFKQFFGYKQDAPLVMTISNWTDDKYRLCSMANSETRKNYRVFTNPQYGASIETARDANPSWVLRKYAPRNEPSFRELTARAGAEPRFLGPATVFNRPFQTTVTALENAKAQVEISFSKDESTKPRDPQLIVSILDASTGWMPTEIKTTEFGGMRTRRDISGWHLLDGIWVYSAATSYIRIKESEPESLHSSEEWDFSQSGQQRNHRAECYLRFYGLPEPAGSDWMWRVSVFIAAVLLISIGYFLLRWRTFRPSAG